MQGWPPGRDAPRSCGGLSDSRSGLMGSDSRRGASVRPPRPFVRGALPLLFARAAYRPLATWRGVGAGRVASARVVSEHGVVSADHMRLREGSVSFAWRTVRIPHSCPPCVGLAGSFGGAAVGSVSATAGGGIASAERSAPRKRRRPQWEAPVCPVPARSLAAQWLLCVPSHPVRQKP